MEFGTIVLCFEKYINHMKSIKSGVTIEDFDLATIKIGDIDRIVQTSFMDYAISCGDKINQFSIPSTLYRHLNTLIRQYQQDTSNQTINKLTQHIFTLEKENGKQLLKPQELETPQGQNTKGWLW